MELPSAGTLGVVFALVLAAVAAIMGGYRRRLSRKEQEAQREREANAGAAGTVQKGLDAIQKRAEKRREETAKARGSLSERTRRIMDWARKK